MDSAPPIETVKIAIAVGAATTRTGDVAAAQHEADARALAGKREGSRS